MLRILGAAVALFLLVAAPTLADPGHIIIAEPEREPNKKVIRAELQKVSSLLRSEMKTSQKIWALPSVKESWQRESACLLGALDEIPEDGPLTDLQALYTVSAVRALQLHILGPDGKARPSFRAGQKRWRTLARRGEIRAIKRLALRKARGVSAASRLPRRDLCQWLQNWRAAGRPDMATWANLSKYSREIREIDRATRKFTSYSVSNLLFVLSGGRFNEESYERISKRARWLSSAQPYAQGFFASRQLWKNWFGENYPE